MIDANGKILLQTLWAGDTQTIQNEINHIVNDATVRYKLSQRMFAPFFRGAGFMHDTLILAGNRSYKELMYGAPPIWALSRLASLLTFLPKENRGSIAALLVLVISVSLFSFVQ